MAKPTLPRFLRDKVFALFEQGASTVEVFDSIFDEAKEYADSDEQLARSISSIKGKHTMRTGTKKPKMARNHLVPNRKKFDAEPHFGVISRLNENTPGKEFEDFCHEIVIDILQNYEGFDRVEDANTAPGFTNPPFDFLGFKDGAPYIIEFKGSLNAFNSPGETQKRRMKEVLSRIKGLNVALLQIKLSTAEYRVFYNDEMDLYFDGYKMPIDPILKWLGAQITDKRK